MNQLQTEELLLLDEVQAEEEYKERFKITDLSGADWAFEKLAAIKTRMKEKEALAEEKRFKIDSWLASETAKDKQSAEYFENILIEYYRELRERDPKAKLSTPAGKVTSRKLQPKWEFDEERAIEYFKLAHPEIIAVKESFNKAEAKKLLQPIGLNLVTDENGEVLEFVAVIPQGESYTVKVD